MVKSIIEKVKAGLPIDDFLIIDSHCHMGYWHNFNAPNNSAEGMIESMDILGIDKACITAHSSIGPDYKYGNDMVIDAVNSHPDRFIGYVTVNPNYKEDMKNELDRCFQVPGMKAIKLHPSFHEASVDDKRYHTAFELADENQCPLLIHIWGMEAVSKVDKLASQYKKAVFIMGHAGGDIDAMRYAIEVIGKHDNVYADIVISRAFEGNVEWLVSQTGSEKLLFGSDMPFIDPRPTFGRLAMAQIDDEDKTRIFGENMKRLLKI